MRLIQREQSSEPPAPVFVTSEMPRLNALVALSFRPVPSLRQAWPIPFD